MTKKLVLLCLALFIIPFLIAGCSKSPEERAIEKFVEQKSGGQVKLDVSQGKITVKEGNTTVTSGAGVKIPDTFPKDVPVYPDTQVLNSMTAVDTIHLTLVSKESTEKIIASYKAKMKQEGWKETASFTAGTMATMAYDKGNRRATIAVSPMNEGQNGIQLQVSQNK